MDAQLHTFSSAVEAVGVDNAWQNVILCKKDELLKTSVGAEITD